MVRKGKVTVVGAGPYGVTTAQRLAECDLLEEVVIADISVGRPQGLALDINQSRAIVGFGTRVTGVTTGPDGIGYDRTAGSDVVVIAAGRPRKPGTSREELVAANAEIVSEVARGAAAFSPDAVLIVVSAPLDEMVAAAVRASGFPPERVIGQTGVLDSGRFAHLVAERLGVPVGGVRALVLGSTGRNAVPVVSACTVDGRPLTDLLAAEEIEELAERTREGTGEVVGLLGAGAYHAPSAAVARMVRAVVEDSGTVLPVNAWLTGQYGLEGLHLGVEAVLGPKGAAVVERELAEDELRQLRAVAGTVRAGLDGPR